MVTVVDVVLLELLDEEEFEEPLLVGGGLPPEGPSA